MADFLIHHLEKKGQQHSSLAMLVNQWGFDQLLIPKALQNVGSLFPHYSRHDESHSKQILVNIERLLADNLSLLTATDTWLLLEAAYWHDIGMVVPQKALEDALAEQGFKDYLAELSRNEHHELHQLASQFDASNPCQCFAGAHSPVDAVDKFRQLMAEWFRRQHARRASEVVQSPWQTIGLNSPRTELIPSRLFRLLGQICLMHGSDFDTMMERLPFREAGMAQEDCHPRFVACLLRLGDLLDLDDNRFCPVMQNIAGDNRPALSKAHEAKHQSIRHLRMDRDRIEVSAECEDIDSYLETWKWFDWLKQEMQQQMSRWSDIVPHRKLGLLPTLGELTVSLKGQEILRDGERPQFSIDGKNAVKLLQGSNLYSDRFACINELVQNAIDSTLIRIWLTDGQYSREEWENPLNPTPQKILHQEENKVLVDVDLEELEGEQDGYFKCVVTIRDAGTGIHQKDLAHMLKIGGSKENKFRQRLIREMPEWMRPSGIFGIGLQSVFLWADEVRIETYSFFDKTGLSVTLHSPMGKDEGLVVIRKPTALHGECNKYGTKLSFEFKTEKQKLNSRLYRGRNHILSTVDPVLGFPVELILIAQKLNELECMAMPRVALGKIDLTLNGRARKTIRIPTESDNVPGQEWHYDQHRKIAISFFNSQGEHRIFYRGRPIAKELYELNYFPFRDVNVNILAGSAENWLALDRGSIVQENLQSFVELVEGGLVELLKLDKIQIKARKPTIQSLFKKRVSRLAFNSAAEDSGRWDRYKDDKEWELFSLRSGVVIRDFLELSTMYLGCKVNSGIWFVAKNSPAVSDVDLFIERISDYALFCGFLICEWKEKHQGRIYPVGKTVYVEDSDDTVGHLCQIDKSIGDKGWWVYQNIFMLSNTPPSSLDVDAAISGALIYHAYLNPGRFLISVEELKAWSCLALKDYRKSFATPLFFWSNENEDCILLPFWMKSYGTLPTVSVDSNELEDLYRWVEKNLKTPMPIEQIRTEYRGLIKYIDDLMLRQDFGKYWALARGLPLPPDEPSLDASPVST